MVISGSLAARRALRLPSIALSGLFLFCVLAACRCATRGRPDEPPLEDHRGSLAATSFESDDAALTAAGRDADSPDAGEPAAGALAGARVEPPAWFDDGIGRFLARWKIPGLAVAATYRGRLILARGYGLADVEAGVPVRERSRFRVASLSKPITAVAVLHLVEQGLVALDAPAFSYLERLPSPLGSRPDPRSARVTVRHLLSHRSGWSFQDYSTGDPLTELPEGARAAAAAMGVPSPADPSTLVRYLRGHVPLRRAPGTAFGYANMNYVVLARVIEAVTGQGYEQYVRESVLAPLGVRRMVVGETLREHQLDDEVVYYDAPGAAPTTSVYSGVTSPVPWPYGGWDLRAMDGAGGWVADVVDYSRFLLSFDGRPDVPDLLSPESVAAMTARPATQRAGTSWYGLGLRVQSSEEGEVSTHSGGLQGTSTVFARYPDGYTVVIFMNSHPSYPSSRGSGYSLRARLDETIDALRRLASTLPGFTEQDLFPLYP